QTDAGAAAPDRVELRLDGLDGLVHAMPGIGEKLLLHDPLPSRDQLWPGMRTTVPTRWPVSTRKMLSPVILKTYSGSSFSMQRLSAVVSMTLSPRSIASRCVSSGMNVAEGSIS